LSRLDKISIYASHAMRKNRHARLQGVEPVAEVAKTGNDVAFDLVSGVAGRFGILQYSLLLVQTLVHECGYNAQLGESLGEVGSAFRRGNQVEEQDTLFWYTLAEEDVNCHERRATW
jgi:hypothetical protein